MQRAKSSIALRFLASCGVCADAGCGSSPPQAASEAVAATAASKEASLHTRTSSRAGMRSPSAEPRDLLRGPAGAGATARRRRRRPPRPPSRRAPSATWRTIARPSPEPGPPARGVGAEEAVEDVGAVVVRDAGAAVAHGQLAVAQPHVDHAAGRAPLGGVVEQVARRRGPAARGRPARARARARSSKRDARARAAARARPRPRRAGRAARPPPAAARARRRGRARRGRRRARSAPPAGRRGRRAAGRGRSGSGGPPRASTSRFVRSDVSGVRSSCEASATSWRCARCERSSASSIVLNEVARRETSSSPCGVDPAREVARGGDVLGGLGQLGHGPDRGRASRAARARRRARSRPARAGRAPSAASRARGRPRSAGAPAKSASPSAARLTWTRTCVPSISRSAKNGSRLPSRDRLATPGRRPSGAGSGSAWRLASARIAA